MIKGILLLFETGKTWERIASVRRRWFNVLFTHVFPLLILTSIAESYSLMHWGRVQSVTLQVKKFPLNEVVAYEGVQFLLTVVAIFICAKLVQSMGDTFHGRHTFEQSFVAVAYGLSPLFLARFLNMIPPLSPWISWIVGVLFSLAILYYGLPCIMQPDPPHAFGLYLTSCLLIVLTTGLVRFITAWYVVGKLTKVEQLFSR